MFLRRKKRQKNGKTHHYYSVVENRRNATGGTCQRQVLYLGEINDRQEASWRRTLEVFDEQRCQTRQMALFAEDPPLTAHDVDALSLRISEIQLLRPRSFGDCWLGLELWRELKLDAFWGEHFAEQAGNVAWEKVLAILTINRLVDPGSEWNVHRQWFLGTALDELLETDFSAVAKDRLYRCLDRILDAKENLCRHLAERWKTLFGTSVDVLLYDLTSTYFEGLGEGIPKARHGYSRDGRPDCRQVVLALVVTPEGLPLAYEVMAGNTSDKTTLAGFLRKIEELYGQARRIWVMDRGIPTEATLQQMRSEGTHYLVGTPKSTLSRMEQTLLDKPWKQVHEAMRVKLARDGEELYILAQSQDRRHKENAMRRRRLKELVSGLNHLKPWRRKDGGRRITRDSLIRKVGVLESQAGRVAKFVEVRIPEPGEAITRKTFRFRFKRDQWRHAWEWDGAYILRGWLPEQTAEDPETLWKMYLQLVHVEEAFKTIKSDLAVRPIWHRTESRVEAHLLVAFLGYALLANLRMKLSRHAPGLTPREALSALGKIKMLDVHIPTTDGRELIMPRHTEPEAEARMVLEKLGLEPPAQPPPRIRGNNVILPANR